MANLETQTVVENFTDQFGFEFILVDSEATLVTDGAGYEFWVVDRN